MFRWSRCLDSIGRGSGNTLGKSMYQKYGTHHEINDFTTFSPNIRDEESERKKKLEKREMDKNGKEPVEKWVISKSGQVIKKLVRSSRSRMREESGQKKKHKYEPSKKMSGQPKKKRSRKEIVCSEKQRKEADAMDTDEYSYDDDDGSSSVDSYSTEDDSDSSGSETSGEEEDMYDDGKEEGEESIKNDPPPHTAKKEEQARALRKHQTSMKSDRHRSRKKKDIFE